MNMVISFRLIPGDVCSNSSSSELLKLQTLQCTGNQQNSGVRVRTYKVSVVLWCVDVRVMNVCIMVWMCVCYVCMWIVCCGICVLLCVDVMWMCVLWYGCGVKLSTTHVCWCIGTSDWSHYISGYSHGNNIYSCIFHCSLYLAQM